jgi:peptide/nickel transport system substrate-binding protein
MFRQKKSKTVIYLFVAVIMIAMSFGACSPSGDSGVPPSGASGSAGGETEGGTGGDKTLTVGTLDAADSFDPTTNANSGFGLPLVYDTILYLDPETGEFSGRLAESFEFPDAQTVVLKIREGIKFSNGDDLTPDDVIFSMQRFVAEGSRFESGFEKIDYDATTIDGNTITLKLIEPAPDFLYSLSNERWASVVDKAYVESTGPDAFWDKPIGTGAYTCVENVAGSHAAFQIREDYWGDKPQAETIKVNYYPELTTMMVDYENNVLDIAVDVGETEYNNAQSGAYENTEIRLMPTWDALSVSLPQYVDAFKDAKVREAVALALDVEGITKAVYGSLGEPADSVLIKGMEYYQAQGVNKYDPEQAKKLLADAGLADGKLELLMLFPSMPTNDKAGTIIQAQLADAGIKLNVESGDFATVIPRLMNNECEFSLAGTGGGAYNASMIFSQISKKGTNGSVRIDDADFNAYVDEGDTSIDSKVREEAYGNAQKWAYESYWKIPIAYPNSATVYHGNIDNLTGMSAKALDFKYITFK